MDARSYGEFSRSVHDHYSGQRAPLSVSIEVTRRCPLECLHCYNNLAMADQEARSRELNKEEHFRLLDDLADWVACGFSHRRRDFCAQGFPGNLHVCEAKRVPDHSIHQRNIDHGTCRGLPTTMAPLCD